MSLADVEQIALKLESVAPDCLNHAADEFERREREMDQNRVDEISYEELIKRVGAERRQ